MSEQNFVFDHVDHLVEYLFKKYGILTPIKLQKGLYFLYAYYGATYGITYGKLEELDGISERNYDDYQFPPRLFDADFEAWTYGPVIRKVWKKHKNSEYNPEENDLNVNGEILLFINELFEQINSVSDFSLVDRSHEDESWSDAYSKGKSTNINKEQLIKEYKDKYV